jgi:hypothetical protein
MEKEGDWLKRITDILKTHTRNNIFTLIQNFKNNYSKEKKIHRIIKSVNYYKILERIPDF